MSKEILFIVGSLRDGSFNHQLAQAVEALLGDQATVKYLEYSQIPMFNQDLETPILPAVAQAREAVLSADAVWIFSPVYNLSIPGLVKNLLDWLSRTIDLSDPSGPSALNGKPITVSSVGHSGLDSLFDTYRLLFPVTNSIAVEPFIGITGCAEAWGTGRLTLSKDMTDTLKEQADALIASIK